MIVQLVDSESVSKRHLQEYAKLICFVLFHTHPTHHWFMEVNFQPKQDFKISEFFFLSAKEKSLFIFEIIVQRLNGTKARCHHNGTRAYQRGWHSRTHPTISHFSFIIHIKHHCITSELKMGNNLTWLAQGNTPNQTLLLGSIELHSKALSCNYKTRQVNLPNQLREHQLHRAGSRVFNA